LRRSVETAQLVPVRVAQISKIELAEAGFAVAGGVATLAV
jgi:hypothetical protein